MRDLPFMLTELRAAYAAGVAPRAVIAEAYRRLEAADDPGIFITTVARAEVLRAAEALGAYDPGKPLWGVPFAVKDNIDVAGLPTTAACPAFAYTPDADAPVVAKLKAAGAICLGKTNLDQFATGLVGLRTPYPVPRNPLDPALVPGGSSSGSAVATARGIVAFALGTDTAGSGRVPAAMNNIVGLKPTRGALSTRGVVPACRSLDCVSVFALSVDDAWAVAMVAQGADPEAPFARDIDLGAIGPLPPRWRIGVPADAPRASFAPLTALGAELVAVDFAPFYAVAELLYQGAFVAERQAAVGAFIERHPDAIDPSVAAVIGAARGLSAAEVFADLYRLDALRRTTEPILAALDCLCVPTVPRPATLAELHAAPIAANSALGRYTNFVNLLDLSALAVPTAGPHLTLIGRAGRDGVLASIARIVQAEAAQPLGATGWRLPPLAAAEARAQNGEIELVVIGAHLSNMPLNRELTARGGRYLRRGPTRPRYRLYALADGKRPGMIQVEQDGAAIEAEVWALPQAGFGDFVARIPPPLGIGTVHLADGTAPSGFLVEPIGLIGASDITRFGGWRAYQAARVAAS